jgi:uncharacterized protein DUF998
MATVTTSREFSAVHERHAARSPLTSLLLGGALIAGPLFVVASFAQALTREGFDLKRHAISMLLLGDQGWIQMANFELTGVLVLACAVGIMRVLGPGRTAIWGTLLFGGYGLGLIVAGINPPDPGLGFPPGAPSEAPSDMSPHAVLHTVGFFVSFISLIAACFVFARILGRSGSHGWARYSFATGVVPLPLIALSLVLGGSGVPLFIMGVITSAWVAAVPLRLMQAASAQAPHRHAIGGI